MSDFKSNYILPKKIPGYFLDFLRFMQQRAYADTGPVLARYQEAWLIFATLGKPRKEKKEKPPKQDAVANQTQAPQPRPAAWNISVLRDFVQKKVLDSEVLTSILEVLEDFEKHHG